MITLQQIQQAKKRLDGIVNYTPLAYAPILSEELNGDVYFKKENLQLTGSFKLRGAFNKIATPFEHFIHAQTTTGMILMVMTLLALVFANTSLAESYQHFFHTKIELPLLSRFGKDSLLLLSYFLTQLL